jgi:hypothetical protein
VAAGLPPGSCFSGVKFVPAALVFCHLLRRLRPASAHTGNAWWSMVVGFDRTAPSRPETFAPDRLLLPRNYAHDNIPPEEAEWP